MYPTRLALVCLITLTSLPAPAEVRLAELQTPPGFTVSVVSDTVRNARQMALGDGGTLFHAFLCYMPGNGVFVKGSKNDPSFSF